MEGLEDVASDNNRQALVEGLGLSEESKSTGPQPSQRMLTRKCWRERRSEVQGLAGDAELH